MKQQLKGSHEFTMNDSLNVTRGILWAPVLQVVILILGTISSFTVAYFKNDVSLYLPFISETGAYSPSMNIFGLCLILGSFIGCVYIFFWFSVIYLNHPEKDKVFHFANVSALIIGVASMVGLAGVAAFPMTTVFWAHLLFAGLYFVGSGIYFLLNTLITYKIYGDSFIFRFRSMLTAAIFILLFILVICFPIALKNWHEHNKIIPALKKPGDEGFTLILISSILEWTIVGVIIFFSLSLIKELKIHPLIMKTSPEQKAVSSEGVPEISENA